MASELSRTHATRAADVVVRKSDGPCSRTCLFNPSPSVLLANVRARSQKAKRRTGCNRVRKPVCAVAHASLVRRYARVPQTAMAWLRW